MSESPPESRQLPVSIRLRLSPRRQWVIVLVTALVLAACLMLGWLATRWFTKAPTAQAEPVAAAPGIFRPTASQLATLKIAPIALVSFRAERVTDGKIALNGDRTTPVFSPYSGRVTRVLGNPGDHVARGQPLLIVEATEFVQGQSDLVSAANAVNTARAQLALAHSNERRKHDLFDAKGGSLQDWQQSQSDLVAAENNLRSTEATLALTRNRLRIQGKSDSEIARLESPERMEPAASVVAPIAGTITDRQVGLGQYVQAAASNPVYLIGDLSTVWLIANVREADAPLVRRGQPVEVRVLALPDRIFKAKITYVAPALDPNSRRLTVRAEVENPDSMLKPEMFASFSIATGTESDAPGVPDSAVVYEGDTARVWVLNGDGTLALRSIRVGRSGRGMVEAVSGLNAGEKVVTSGTLFIDRAGRGD